MNPMELRSEIVYRRTYSRPLNNEGTEFETWEQTIERVIDHQRWLWERAQDMELSMEQHMELSELRELMLNKKASVSGRTLWLGGTKVSQVRETSQFNCSGLVLSTVNDVVDMIWLLLNGCGVGFVPEVGVLNGFLKPIKNITVINSELKEKKEGVDNNEETVIDGTWTIKVGDSAEAWAKAFGKLVAGKYNVHTLVFDLSNIRPAGERLKGYGWIGSGDEALGKALVAVAEILNKKAGQLLNHIDLLDLGNWLGTILSSRRSAEIAFHRFGDEGWEEFSMAKKDCYKDNPQRMQSNNSLLFYNKPTKLELRGLFEMMLEAGGSEPGFINAEASLKRAPWFKLLNPCAEVLLGDKSYCCLVETNVAAFNGDLEGLKEAAKIIGRANYRQTLVDLRDGILQDSWHELNEFLRLTGTGITGYVNWEYMDNPEILQELKGAFKEGVKSMSDELGTTPSKNVTLLKPSGTLSKILKCPEGVHKPLGKYIFNNIIFAKADPMVPKLRGAGYRMFDNPNDNESIIITFPIKWDNIDFDTVMKNGRVMEVNTESAVVQLERYKVLMDNFVDQNASNTISYSPEEVPEIVDWLYNNWDSYVGVSWLLRADPTKSAQDLGYHYLPQEVQFEDDWYNYYNSLREVDLSNTESFEELSDQECSSGLCPIK